MTIIYQSPDPYNLYVGTPSICEHGGDIYASWNHFSFGGSAGTTGNLDEWNRTFWCKSADGGLTWTQPQELVDCFWACLESISGELYMTCTNHRWGQLEIRKFDGLTFNKVGEIRPQTPSDNHWAASSGFVHNGYFLRSFLRRTSSTYTFRNACLAVPIADFENMAAWKWSQGNWEGGSEHKYNGQDALWLEGAVVPFLTDLALVHRVNDNHTIGSSIEIIDKTAINIVEMQNGGEPNITAFSGYYDLPGGHSQFGLRWCTVHNKYLLISNPSFDGTTSDRNTLKIFSSDDLATWIEVYTIYEDEINNSIARDRNAHSYVDWRFSGSDIIMALRVSINGKDKHDTNGCKFVRIEDYGQHL